LQFNGETCEEVNKFCALEFEDYRRISREGETYYYCNECVENAYFDEESSQCESCTIIPNCLSCSDGLECEECGSNYILNE